MKSTCQCGANEIAIRTTQHNSLNCHCGMCRGQSGAAFTTWVTIDATQVDLENRVDKLTQYQVGEHARSFFCSICGTNVYTLDNRHPEIVAFPAGVLRGIKITPPTDDYFYSHKAEWLSETGETKKYGGQNGFTPMTNITQ